MAKKTQEAAATTDNAAAAPVDWAAVAAALLHLIELLAAAHPAQQMGHAFVGQMGAVRQMIERMKGE